MRLAPLPLVDNYLLEALPGLTLAQIDAMDVHRLARALQVRRIREVETRRQLVLDDKLKSDAMSADEWRMIHHHDRLMGISET